MRYAKKILALAGLCLGITTITMAENLTSESFTLHQAIDYALLHNPDLQIMQNRIQQANTQLDQAMSAFYPEVKARLGYEHSDNPARAFAMIIAQRRLNLSGGTDFNHPGGVDNYRPEISLQYSLFRGGQDYYGSKAAQSGVDAAKLDKTTVRNQLIEMITRSFYQYLAALENHKVTLHAIEAIESELKQSRLRYAAGTELKSDVLSLEVQAAAAHDQEIHAANVVKLIKTSLKILMGLTAEQTLALDSNHKPELPPEPADFTQLLAKAMQQRPDYQAADKRLQMAKLKLRAAQGVHLPSANAYVNYGSDSKNIDFSSNRDNVTAGVMVEMSLFSGFRDSAKVDQAKHQLAIARKNLTKTRLQIENDVKSARLKLAEALNRVNVAKASVAAAEEALRMVTAQRDSGVVTVTRFIEAQVARDQAHARHIAAYFDALGAQAQLNQAIGSIRD